VNYVKNKNSNIGDKNNWMGIKKILLKKWMIAIITIYKEGCIAQVPIIDKLFDSTDAQKTEGCIFSTPLNNHPAGSGNKLDQFKWTISDDIWYNPNESLFQGHSYLQIEAGSRSSVAHCEVQ